jgi:hypothetical protein
MASKTGATAPPPTTIVAAVGRAPGSGSAVGSGSRVAAGAGTSKVRGGFAVAFSVGPREIAALAQRGSADEQARAAGGKARHAPLADARRPHIQRFWQSLDAGVPRHEAEQAALRAMREEKIKLPESDRATRRLFAREKR